MGGQEMERLLRRDIFDRHKITALGSTVIHSRKEFPISV
jgi:hypothetical protein